MISATPIVALDVAPAQEPRIEIAIRDFTYVRTKMEPMRAGTPMVFVIHNEDAVRHGFISPLFLSRSVQGEGEGIEAFRTGIEGFHLDPDKTLAIRLTPDRQGKMTLRCDLHPEVQGDCNCSTCRSGNLWKTLSCRGRRRGRARHKWRGDL